THGCPGGICLGPDFLEPGKALAPFREQGFEKAFRPNARITFNGCNAASGPFGEWFLVQIGQIFFSEGGGIVRGNASLEVSEPWFTGDVHYPASTWVTASVAPGGQVCLSNHRHLERQWVEERLTKAQSHLDGLEARRATERLASAREALAKAA